MLRMIVNDSFLFSIYVLPPFEIGGRGPLLYSLYVVSSALCGFRLSVSLSLLSLLLSVYDLRSVCLRQADWLSVVCLSVCHP